MIGRSRRAAEQFTDLDNVAGRYRLHDVGPLRDAFETTADIG